MRYKIQTGVNNPILRTVSDDVKDISADLKEFCATLRHMMRTHDGVGLAAPQLGRNIRVIATTQREKKGDDKKVTGETIMINPKLTAASEEQVVWEEACLSLPEIFGMVRRHKTITVQYMDLKGNIQTKKLKDFNARIIQHEMDHLDGILFVDKLVKEKKKK